MSVKQLIDQVVVLQTELGYPPNEFESAEKHMQYIRDLCLALNVEVTEFLQELPWKPWRVLADQKYDQKKAAEELADIMVFVLNLWVHLGAYPKDKCANELVKQVTRKQNKNAARLTSGRNRRNEK